MISFAMQLHSVNIRTLYSNHPLVGPQRRQVLLLRSRIPITKSSIVNTNVKGTSRPRLDLNGILKLRPQILNQESVSWNAPFFCPGPVTMGRLFCLCIVRQLLSCFCIFIVNVINYVFLIFFSFFGRFVYFVPFFSLRKYWRILSAYFAPFM